MSSLRTVANVFDQGTICEFFGEALRGEQHNHIQVFDFR